MSKPDIERLRALAIAVQEADKLTVSLGKWKLRYFEAAVRLGGQSESILALLDASSEAEALRAEVDRLKKDSARLDFLDSSAATQEPAGQLRTWLWARPFGSGGLRKMIDGAIAASKPAVEKP